MPRDPQPSGRFVLDQHALRRLLDSLDADPGRASQRYERLRRSLIKVFAWEQHVDAEALADETFDRVSRRLAEGTVILDVPAYAQRIAELVHLETRRTARRRDATRLDQARAVAPRTADAEVERRHACLERCLDRLGPEPRDLVVRYYTHDGRARIEQRDAIARELGLSAGALRNRMLRLRERLESCVRSCVGPRDESGGRDT